MASNTPPTSDADIDALLGETFARVGMSPQVLEQSARLQAMLDESEQARRPVVDPREKAVRFHALSRFASSPAHYLHACQGFFADSVAIRIGSGFHAALFQNRPVLVYTAVRNGKKWDRFEAAALERNAVVLSEREYAIEMAMVDAVRRHDRAMELLFGTGTIHEETIEWEIDGRKCRATPDSMIPALRSTELKSTRNAEPRALIRDALRRLYHCQLGWYDDGIEAKYAVRPRESFIVAVENLPPHNVTILTLPAEIREAASRANRLWWEQLRVAEATGIYSGYVDHDVELVDPYANHDDDEGGFALTVGGEEITL